MNQKSLTAILVVVIMLLTGVVVYLAVGKTPTPIATPTVIQSPAPAVVAPTVQPTSVPAAVAVDAWKSYTNEKYGFALNFPDTWKGYAVTAHDNENWSDLCFSFKQPQSFCLFQLIIFNKSQWAKAGSGQKQNILSQTENAVITCEGCCQVGGDTTGGGQFDKFQTERCQEAPGIIKTFQLTK